MQWAAFFRGINVGGKHIVKMAALREMFEKNGAVNARTYVQSGNVVFSAEVEEGDLLSSIRHAFEETFGFESHVMLRSGVELAQVVENLPFSAEEIAEAEVAEPDVVHLYVFLLDEAVPQAEVDSFCQRFPGQDKLRAGKRELYLLCYGSIRDSKVANGMGKLTGPATARNWKTICQVMAMMT